ncbi:MAG: hypothetical protein ACFCD0_24520 [Gemmataceae bacterium]
MTLDDFILSVFCLVDDYIQQHRLDRLRQRDPKPLVDDSEIINIKLVGEFLEMDKDSQIF